ncbi:hypothetical protein Stsp01_34820 [Streptomyces sp. NBRC 13847]|nr:hypothetical protein Stsp01_34820 [Streptomyces sp. NBRC 13847]
MPPSTPRAAIRLRLAPGGAGEGSGTTAGVREEVDGGTGPDPNGAGGRGGEAGRAGGGATL